MDEHTSFIGQQSSPARRILEQSVFSTYLGNNESYLDPNPTLNGYVDGSVYRNHPMRKQSSPFSPNESKINQKPPSSHLDSSQSPNRMSEFINYFSGFNFASPPLADTQILRVLENQLLKKQRD